MRLFTGTYSDDSLETLTFLAHDHSPDQPAVVAAAAAAVTMAVVPIVVAVVVAADSKLPLD